MNTLSELLAKSVTEHGASTALKLWTTKGTVSWSYRELDEASSSVAALLQQRGIAKGDRVAIWGPNRPEWVAAFFGCLRAGAIAVPFDVRASDDFLARVLGKAQPKLVVAGEEQAPSITALSERTIILEEIVALARGEGATLTDVDINGDDIAELVFTSGTTGNPKGVILTHRNMASNLASIYEVVNILPSYRLLSLLPLSHMFEMTIGLLAPLAGGASITYIDSLQPATIFQAMKEERITCMACVPQVLQLFMSGVEREVARSGRERKWRLANRLASVLPLGVRRRLFKDLHQRMGGGFEFFVCGGAYLDPRLAAKWERLGIKVLQGYGTTEAAPVLTCDSLSDREHHYVGRSLPGVELRIAEDGEILARGPNITPGYWDDPIATSEAFEDSWYKTGDIGSFSRSGRLKLVGRKKNIIVLSNGMNVYPEDIEEVMKEDSRVKDAVVIGLGEGGREVEVHAILLMEDAAEAREVVRAANRRLALHQQVKGFKVWPEPDFPRTHTLKPKRPEIIEALGTKL